MVRICQKQNFYPLKFLQLQHFVLTGRPRHPVMPNALVSGAIEICQKIHHQGYLDIEP